MSHDRYSTGPERISWNGILVWSGRMLRMPTSVEFYWKIVRYYIIINLHQGREALATGRDYRSVSHAGRRRCWADSAYPPWRDRVGF